jgi:hypothetical protein
LTVLADWAISIETNRFPSFTPMSKKPIIRLLAAISP